VNTPTASDKQANSKFFHDFENNVDIPFFFIKKAAVSNSIIPAKVMLMAEIRIGGMCRKVVVKNSMRIDSIDMVIA
jgi:hypothetical protein